MRLTEIKDSKRKWLQWVVDFIQMKLESLSKAQKETLLDHLVHFTSENFPHRIPIRANFDYYMSHYCPPPEDRDEQRTRKFDLAESDMGRTQEELRKMLENIQEVISTPSPTPWKNYGLCESLALLSIGSYFTGDEPMFQVSFRPKDNDDLVIWAKLHFAQLLGGLPVHAITKCRGCSA